MRKLPEQITVTNFQAYQVRVVRAGCERYQQWREKVLFPFEPPMAESVHAVCP